MKQLKKWAGDCLQLSRITLFQLTNSTTFPYDSYAASPVHRFYQMWQQSDCNANYATTTNPSGCLATSLPGPR